MESSIIKHSWIRFAYPPVLPPCRHLCLRIDRRRPVTGNSKTLSVFKEDNHSMCCWVKQCEICVGIPLMSAKKPVPIPCLDHLCTVLDSCGWPGIVSGRNSLCRALDFAVA